MVCKLILVVLSLAAMLSAALGITACLPIEYVLVTRQWLILDGTETLDDGVEFRKSPRFRFRHTTVLEQPYSDSLKPGVLVGPAISPTYGPIYLHAYVHYVYNETQTLRHSATEVPSYVPLALAVLLGTYPALAFCRGPFRRWKRSRKGLCLKCGYDLTGNESGTCPECGTGT